MGLFRWMYGEMNGRVDGWLNGGMERWMDRWINILQNLFFDQLERLSKNVFFTFFLLIIRKSSNSLLCVLQKAVSPQAVSQPRVPQTQQCPPPQGKKCLTGTSRFFFYMQELCSVEFCCFSCRWSSAKPPISATPTASRPTSCTDPAACCQPSAQ